MNKLLKEKIEIVKDAFDSQKGMFWLWEILVFILVFIIYQIIIGVGIVLVMCTMLFTNEEFVKAILSGRESDAMQIGMQFAYSEEVLIASLFLEILLILLVCLFCKLIQKRKMPTLGFCKKGAIKEYLIGAVVGAAIFTVAVLGSVATGAMKIEGISPEFSIGIFVLYLFGFMIQGMAEEVLCRGYFMVSFARRYPMIAAVLLNSIVFAVLHLSNPGMTPLSFLNLALFGIFASFYFIRRGNIWGIGALHSVWNFVQGNVYGIHVSGISELNSLFSISINAEKELLNGGAFGLEGSIMVTIVLLMGIAFLYFYRKRDVV